MDDAMNLPCTVHGVFSLGCFSLGWYHTTHSHMCLFCVSSGSLLCLILCLFCVSSVSPQLR